MSDRLRGAQNALTSDIGQCGNDWGMFTWTLSIYMLSMSKTWYNKQLTSTCGIMCWECKLYYLLQWFVPLKGSCIAAHSVWPLSKITTFWIYSDLCFRTMILCNLLSLPNLGRELTNIKLCHLSCVWVSTQLINMLDLALHHSACSQLTRLGTSSRLLRT